MAATDEADSLYLELQLMLGPPMPAHFTEFTDGQLERGWKAYGGALTESLLDHPRPGLRPWGFWRFVVNRPELNEDENYPEAVGVLAEMGELTEAELTKLAEGAVSAASSSPIRPSTTGPTRTLVGASRPRRPSSGRRPTPWSA